MNHYSTLTLTELLDAFASSEPVPGGGSAAALSGAVGVSLLLMVAGLPKTRSGTPAEREALNAAAARLRPLRERLTTLIDRDSDAYTAVLNAYRLPKGTDADKAARTEAIRAAMHGATETPLETMRACRQALQEAPAIVSSGLASAATDAAVAVELLRAALRGAGLNVDVNADSLKDADYVSRIRDEKRMLEAAT
jgi:methenyltetrahydrofolate cyclohydrolase